MSKYRSKLHLVIGCSQEGPFQIEAVISPGEGEGRQDGVEWEGGGKAADAQFEKGAFPPTWQIAME